ncbi:unnamed protein product [Brassicogethes aeneus]|uniref:NADP-dependent oxidoreductase domain-containing protein n=1 Tax=Brassicogethes aeneus TaxID=1431903 RepID=A0A9P0BEF1_BRAAE|nr:unnamed protein product [Brassicogethes aeneus]
MSRSLKLNNGNEIPIVGLGTYKSKPGEVAQAVKDAIDAGYRHFDCAWFYGNENEVGLGLNAKIDDGTVKREDIFVTSKLWNNFHEKKCVLPKIKETLAALKLDYLDLYLIHWPFGFKENAPLWPVGEVDSYSDVDYLETWQAMEECVKQNLTKSIGVSNFNAAQIERILENCTIKPAVNQVEVNPNLNQKKLIDFCKKHDIVITGYCPLGRSEFAGTPGFPDPTIFDPKVKEIGEKYRKTPAQVVLNYLGQPGEVETAILNAIEAGYRHFDCAWFYGNEKEIGNAFNEAITKKLIKREDIFITSKVYITVKFFLQLLFIKDFVAALE